ncbi:PREDICTED: uncharacterized protein LOC109359903 [Lupinus angustifolius]|uniref:uncharacterized protein LOC109359903 n=1 Tax=Lupinus angustifolius TaxID=3871 RepID=UPI00092F634E|nr:PREDICTED: uncharacterized protein LOC109359903 [Lupinus angustifolius]
MTSSPPLIPWSFLGDMPDLPHKVKPNTQSLSKPSFLQALKGLGEVSISQLPLPCVKGDAIAIKIPEAEYQAGLQRRGHEEGLLNRILESQARVDLVSDKEDSSVDSYQGEAVLIEVSGNVVDTIEPEVVRTQHELPQPHGDRNTSFFHRVAKVRQHTKALTMLKEGDNILTIHDDISTHVLAYFTALYASSNTIVPNGLISSVIPHLVTEDDNFLLTKHPSNEEIRSVVFSMKGDGAPGPDGFGGCFFQAFWENYRKFTDWIKTILHSAKLSINVNGQSVGFFSCRRGVRQGDPLSPLLFCLAEDVLSRGISKLVLEGQLCPISGPSNLYTPSHVLYDDDILIFYKGIKRNIMALKTLIIDYANASGQHISLSKCRFYSTSASPRKILALSSTLGFSHDSLLQNLDKCIRNFIWSGDTSIRKIATVSWHKVCSPSNSGGLGLRSIKAMNQAALIKLAWEMFSSNQEWAILYRHRFGRGTSPSQRYFKSSIWPGIKSNWHTVMSNSIWLVGEGKSVNFWLDNWLGSPLMDSIHIPEEFHSSLLSKIDDFTQDCKWIIPKLIHDLFPQIASNIADTIIINKGDQFVWQGTMDGSLPLQAAYNYIRPNANHMTWCKAIWSDSIPQSKSFTSWRLFHRRMPTDENLQLRGCSLVSMCSLCKVSSETSDHLFLLCPFAVDLWHWIGGIFHIQIDNSSLAAILSRCNLQWSPQIKGVLAAAIVHTVNTIWHCRNFCRF